MGRSAHKLWFYNGFAPPVVIAESDSPSEWIIEDVRLEGQYVGDVTDDVIGLIRARVDDPDDTREWNLGFGFECGVYIDPSIEDLMAANRSMMLPESAYLDGFPS